jgi:hypothetical protein
MSDIEARRHGGRFASHLPPLETDEEFLEVLGPITVAHWRRIERVDEPIARPRSDQPGEMSVEVTFAPAGPPFWQDHFRTKLRESGFGELSGHSDGRHQSITLRCPAEQTERTGNLVDEAIDYANNQFEANELAGRTKGT